MAQWVEVFATQAWRPESVPLTSVKAEGENPMTTRCTPWYAVSPHTQHSDTKLHSISTTPPCCLYTCLSLLQTFRMSQRCRHFPIKESDIQWERTKAASSKNVHRNQLSPFKITVFSSNILVRLSE